MIFNDKLFQAFSQTERDLDAYIEIKGVKYGASDLLKDLKVNAKADVDGVWIGRAIPKMLKAEIINNGVEIHKGDEIKAFFGVKIDKAYEYINVGTYYAQNPEYSEDRKLIKVTAYDKLKAMQTIKHGKINYPITIKSLLDLISNKANIKIDTVNLLFTDYEIKEEVFFGKDKTLIELIIAIAQMNMCFAYINYDNVLTFRRVKYANAQIYQKNIFRYRYKGEVKGFNAVVISRQPQNDDVAKKDEEAQEANEIKISNNPILDLNREKFLTKLYSEATFLPKFKGLENLTMQSNPLLEVGDVIRFDYSFIGIYEHEITMTRSVLKSQIAEKTETDYRKAKGIEDLAINTEFFVNKIKNEIVGRVGDEVGSKLTELKLDEKGITQRVESVFKANKDSLKGDDGSSFEWNLLLNSKRTVTNSDYPLVRYDLADTNLKHGEIVTLVVKAKLGENKEKFGMFNSEGYVAITDLDMTHEDFDENGIAIKTGKWKADFPQRPPKNDRLLIYPFLSTVKEESTIEWAKLVRGDKTTKEWAPHYSELYGSDGKDAFIPSYTPPQDTSRYWMDLNTNKLKYFDKTTDSWKELNEELEERIQKAESNVTDEAIINKVTKSETWKLVADKANSALSSSDFTKKINEFSTSELTSDKLMTKISNTTTWSNLNDKLNSKVDASGVSSSINTWANQTLTNAYFNTKLSQTQSYKDLNGKLTTVDSRTSRLEQTVKDFTLEFTKETQVNENLIPRTEDFSKAIPPIEYGEDLFVEKVGSLLRLYDPTNNSHGGSGDRWEFRFNREIRLTGQTFWLTMSVAPEYTAMTKIQFRLQNGDGNWSLAASPGGEVEQFRMVRLKVVAPNSGKPCRGIYLNIYNTKGVKQSAIRIQSKTLKCEIGGNYTAWSSAETDEINGANYYFGLDGVKFTYNNEDVLKVNHNNGLYVKGNGEFTGNITATSGTIGNFNISSVLRSKNGQNGSFLQIDGRGTYPFLQAGDNSNGYKFAVTTKGELYAKGAEIDGNIKARGGTIGAFIISQNSIQGPNGLRLSGHDELNPLRVNGSYINKDGYGRFGSGNFIGSHGGSGDFSSGSYRGTGNFSNGRLGGSNYNSGSEGLKLDFADIKTAVTNLLVLGGSGRIKGPYHSGPRDYMYMRFTLTGWELSNSDIRLKENIKELGHEYDKYIYDLPLIKYNYIGDDNKNPQAGVNANYLMKILPEEMAKSFLHQDDITGYYGAKYELLIPYAIKAIQDLNNRLKEIENGKHN